MNIPIRKIRTSSILPLYQTKNSSGMDLVADIPKPLTLQPHERVIIPTGIAIALPEGYEAQIRGRSGLAAKYGIVPANGVGTIDADYRGEVSAILLNTSTEPFIIEPGMRIAQMVVARYEQIGWNEVDELDETERGSGGFGSTGK